MDTLRWERDLGDRCWSRTTATNTWMHQKLKRAGELLLQIGRICIPTDSLSLDFRPQMKRECISAVFKFSTLFSQP